MKVFEGLSEWREFRRAFGGRLGFVPTMGALHEGHLSLVARAKRENDAALVCLFVNPTQFDNPDDFENYPKTLAEDLALLERKETDFVLVPRAADVYPDRFTYEVREKERSLPLCGGSRPGHFTGMLTVVMKLLNLARASRAYFGEKDYQQLLLIRGMAEAFFLETEIVAAPTVRESDGLAMSSRNLRLTPPERALAPRFAALLRSASTVDDARAALEGAGFRVDYVEDKWGRRFGAVFLGPVRLIDNVEL